MDGCYCIHIWKGKDSIRGIVLNAEKLNKESFSSLAEKLNFLF